MKLLIDENLPKKLKYSFKPEFECYDVYEMKWNSLENGDLLSALVKAEFYALITSDKNLQFQQNLKKYEIKFVVIDAVDNQYETVLPAVEKAKEFLRSDSNESCL